MALIINPARGGFGAVSLKLTKQGSDSDFLGFEFWETNDQYAVADEVLMDRVEDVTLTDYTFHFTRPSGIYYFNAYAINFARNRSTPVNLTIQVNRYLPDIPILDPVIDLPWIGYLWSDYTFGFSRTIEEGTNSLHVNWLGVLEDMI